MLSLPVPAWKPVHHDSRVNWGGQRPQAAGRGRAAGGAGAGSWHVGKPLTAIEAALQCNLLEAVLTDPGLDNPQPLVWGGAGQPWTSRPGRESRGLTLRSAILRALPRTAERFH